MSGKVESCADNSYAHLDLRCDVCHKYFNGKKPYYEHLQSNNHKKKLREKALLSVASQEILNPQVTPLHPNELYKKDLTSKKKAVDDSQYCRLNDLEKSKFFSSAGWKPLENIVCPKVLFPESDDKECKSFYVECVVCQLYFTSQKSATMHFSSDEHKRKDAHHKDIEELYNNIKNIDIQDVVENLLCETPSINTIGKNMKANIIDTTVISHKHGTLKTDEMKLPHTDGKIKEKTYPGCELCGISSFSTVIASLNHLTTPQHCRRSAMQTEAARLNSNISRNELPPVVSSVNSSQKERPVNYENIAIPPHLSLNNEHYYKSCKEEQKKDETVPLNPIGYERKQKHKQYQQSDSYAIEQPLSLPGNYSFDYNDKASSIQQCVLEFDYKSFLNKDLPLATQALPSKCVSKPFPRLAVTFPQSNLNTQQKNLSGIEVIQPNQDFLF